MLVLVMLLATTLLGVSMMETVLLNGRLNANHRLAIETRLVTEQAASWLYGSGLAASRGVAECGDGWRCLPVESRGSLEYRVRFRPCAPAPDPAVCEVTDAPRWRLVGDVTHAGTGTRHARYQTMLD